MKENKRSSGKKRKIVICFDASSSFSTVFDSAKCKTGWFYAYLYYIIQQQHNQHFAHRSSKKKKSMIKNEKKMKIGIRRRTRTRAKLIEKQMALYWFIFLLSYLNILHISLIFFVVFGALNISSPIFLKLNKTHQNIVQSI